MVWEDVADGFDWLKQRKTRAVVIGVRWGNGARADELMKASMTHTATRTHTRTHTRTLFQSHLWAV